MFLAVSTKKQQQNNLTEKNLPKFGVLASESLMQGYLFIYLELSRQLGHQLMGLANHIS